MSLLKGLKKAAKGLIKTAPSAALGYASGGPAGALLGAVSSAQARSMPGQGLVPGFGGMSSLPPLIRGVATIGGAAGGYAIRGARAITATAISYCRKYPSWCSTIGGVAAVEALVGNGSLPIIKRRRRRGITPRDLASFRRVASLIKSYGPTARKVPSGCAPRKSCRRS